MTKRKKRSLEREITSQLYKNLTREGISMDHLDPTKLDNWPLIDYPKNRADYINLLPPSYRNPSIPPGTRTLSFRQSLEEEWPAKTKKQINHLRNQSNNTEMAQLMITVTGLLLTISIALILL